MKPAVLSRRRLWLGIACGVGYTVTTTLSIVVGLWLLGLAAACLTLMLVTLRPWRRYTRVRSRS